MTAEYSNPYKKLVAMGIPIDHHESDLYVLSTPESLQVVNDSGWSHTSFVSQIDNKLWLGLPFAYEPFWEPKQKGAQ